MKSLQRLATEQKSRYILLWILSLLVGSIIIFQAYFIASIVDGVFLKDEDFQDLIPILLLLLIVLLGRAAFTYGIGRIGVYMAAKVKQDYRKKLLSAYSNHSLLNSFQGQTGAKVSVMMEAVDELDRFFSQYVPQRILSTVIPLMIVITVFTQHLYSGLIILITAPFIPIFMVIIGKFTQRKAEEQLDRLTDFSGRFLDTLQGFVSLKIFGRAGAQREKIKQSSLDFRDSTMSLLKIAFTSSFMLEFISMLSIGLVALELGLRLVVFNQITFFTAFFVLLMVPEFYTSLKELGSAFHAGRSSMGAATKVEQELQQTEQRVKWGQNKFEVKQPVIELRQIGFQYRSKGFTLENIQAQIAPQQQTVIVGKSGSGKTTLLHILAGLITPSEGEVWVNRLPINEYKEEEWFKQMSYITQHPFLFSGTIEENIALGTLRKVTFSEVRDAASQAGIHEFIEALPHGYETLIGEAGRGLSGGEKQRVALARAFLKKPSIILFDEPTMGLDLYTEQILQASIHELAQDSTVITVAHRIQTIKQAKQVLFLDEGKLIAIGTHDELIRSNETYRTLFSKKNIDEVSGGGEI